MSDVQCLHFLTSGIYSDIFLGSRTMVIFSSRLVLATVPQEAHMYDVESSATTKKSSCEFLEASLSRVVALGGGGGTCEETLLADFFAWHCFLWATVPLVTIFIRCL